MGCEPHLPWYSAWTRIHPSSPLLQPTHPPPRARLLSRAGFAAALAVGDKAAVHPVLAFLLSRLPALKKRAYVARYLLPVGLPPDLQHDEAVGDALGQYAVLQAEFKETHVAYEKAAGGWGSDVSLKP